MEFFNVQVALGFMFDKTEIVKTQIYMLMLKFLILSLPRDGFSWGVWWSQDSGKG